MPTKKTFINQYVKRDLQIRPICVILALLLPRRQKSPIRETYTVQYAKRDLQTRMKCAEPAFLFLDHVIKGRVDDSFFVEERPVVWRARCYDTMLVSYHSRCKLHTIVKIQKLQWINEMPNILTICLLYMLYEMTIKPTFGNDEQDATMWCA